MIFFCYFCLKKLLILGVAHNYLLFVQIGLKKQFSRSFHNFFLELSDCNTSY